MLGGGCVDGRMYWVSDVLNGTSREAWTYLSYIMAP